MSLMICSTSHRQRGVRLLLLVAGAVFLSLHFFRAFFFLGGGGGCLPVCLFLHFMVYSVETVSEAFSASSPPPPPRLSFVVLRKIVTLIFF